MNLRPLIRRETPGHQRGMTNGERNCYSGQPDNRSHGFAPSYYPRVLLFWVHHFGLLNDDLHTAMVFRFLEVHYTIARIFFVINQSAEKFY